MLKAMGAEMRAAHFRVGAQASHLNHIERLPRKVVQSERRLLFSLDQNLPPTACTPHPQRARTHTHCRSQRWHAAQNDAFERLVGLTSIGNHADGYQCKLATFAREHHTLAPAYPSLAQVHLTAPKPLHQLLLLLIHRLLPTHPLIHSRRHAPI